MYYKIIILPIFLYLLNFFLIKLNFLVDNPEESYHKLEKKSGTPLSGGLFLLFGIIFIYISNTNILFKLNISIFLILILVLGIFSDIKKDFSPKIRIIFQLIIIFLFLLINKEILVERTNIDFLDFVLQNQFIKFFFTIFCIITVLNGFNFMDGVNGFVSGYILSLLIILYLILLKSNQSIYFEDLIIIYIVFFLFNIFGKCFFGDNGIYISSLLVSAIIIKTTNINPNISPIVAVSLLWYPAIENLFTIIRRSLNKKATYLPDKLHLHSLILRKLHLNFKFIPKNFKNTLTGLLINIFLLPTFIFTYFFYDKSWHLGIFVSINIFVYLITYNFLFKKLKR